MPDPSQRLGRQLIQAYLGSATVVRSAGGAADVRPTPSSDSGPAPSSPPYSAQTA